MGGVAGLDPNYLDSCLKAGVADYVDAIAYHPYPETLQFLNYAPQEWNCRYIVSWLRNLISTYTTKPLKIWLTELGWATCTNFPPGARVRLVKGGNYVQAYNVDVVSPSSISCTMGFFMIEAGTYDAVVMNPDGSEGRLAGAVNVKHLWW